MDHPLINSFLHAQCPLSEEGKRLEKISGTLMMIHIGFAVAKCILLNIMSGIGDFVAVAILFCGLRQNNYCNILFYVIYCMVAAFTLFTVVGYKLQTGGDTGVKGAGETFMIIFAASLFVFYIIADYFAYKTYREFKGCMYDHGGSISNPLSVGSYESNQSYGATAPPAPGEDKAGKFVPFKGKGHSLNE